MNVRKKINNLLKFLISKQMYKRTVEPLIRVIEEPVLRNRWLKNFNNRNRGNASSNIIST